MGGARAAGHRAGEARRLYGGPHRLLITDPPGLSTGEKGGRWL